MKLTNVTEVKQAFENIVNEGRHTKIKLGDKISPSQAMERLTAEDLNKFDVFNSYKGISANSYDVKMSMLWTSLFWKIGEQILIVGQFITPFSRFYKELEVGADIEELAPRIKQGIDRTTLSNSALFTNYITQYDSFIHRINQFKVFASTYDQYEIARISNTWTTLTSMLNSELENILKSSGTYLHRLSKNALSTQYLQGGMDFIEISPIVDKTTAEQGAIAINNTMDEMSLEPTSKYIPFNRNANNATPIEDVSTSNFVLIATADILNNIEFLTHLNTYFDKSGNNGRYSFNVIKVTDFNNAISADIDVTPGYTPLVSPKKLKAVLIEENGLIFRQKNIGTFNFDNAATLKTTTFHHIDAMANVSDRRKCVAFVER